MIDSGREPPPASLTVVTVALENPPIEPFNVNVVALFASVVFVLI